MNKVHFIAIGGSAMHNLAIALKLKGYNVSGSDDEIFEPSKSRLKKYNILPESNGWNANNITTDIDAIILGMHAKTQFFPNYNFAIKINNIPVVGGQSLICR